MSTLSEPATTTAERRASGFQPIAAYGLLADCTSAALVDLDGSIDWLCMPHFDSPALFAADPRPQRRPLVDRAGRPEHLRAPLSARHARDRDDLHHRDRQRAPGRRDGLRPRPARPRPRARRAARGAAPGRGDRRHGRARDGARAASRVRARAPAVPDGGWRRAHLRRPQPDRGLGRRSGGHRRLDHACDLHRRRGRARRLRTALGAGPRRAPGRVRARRRRRSHRRHRRGLALLGGRARRLRRLAQGARLAQHARAQGPDLPADRRHRRRADLLAARGRGRRAQLGLPLRVDPRRQPDHRGALHRRLLGRGRGVRLLHDELGRRARQRRLAADHVRNPRGARPLRARARAPARLARLAPRARGQRRLEPDAARRLRGAAQRPAHLPGQARRAAPRDPGLRRRPRRHRRAALARDRLGDLGDARRAASPPVVEGPVLDGARPRGQARAQALRARRAWPSGPPSATAFAKRSSSAAGARPSRPTRSPSTPTSSTPPHC